MQAKHHSALTPTYSQGHLQIMLEFPCFYVGDAQPPVSANISDMPTSSTSSRYPSAGRTYKDWSRNTTPRGLQLNGRRHHMEPTGSRPWIGEGVVHGAIDSVDVIHATLGGL